MLPDELLNLPVRFEVAGRAFPVSELSIDAKGRLQVWLKDHIPHPLAVVRSQLHLFEPQDRATLLDQARREAQQWPPVVDSPAGMNLLFSTPDGHRAMLTEALRAHNPDVTPFDVEWLYRHVRTDKAKSAELIGILFGVPSEDLELGDDGPKAA